MYSGSRFYRRAVEHRPLLYCRSLRAAAASVQSHGAVQKITIATSVILRVLRMLPGIALVRESVLAPNRLVESPTVTIAQPA